MESKSLTSALAGGFFTTITTWEAQSRDHSIHQREYYEKTLKNNHGNSINPMRLQSHEEKQYAMFLYFQPCKEKWVGTVTHPFNQHLLSSYNLPGSAPDAGDSPSSESIKVCVGCTSLENY